MQNGIFISLKIDFKTLFFIMLFLWLSWILYEFVFNNKNTHLAFDNGSHSINKPNTTSEESNNQDIEKIILSKIKYFKEELIITSDTGRKFELEKELEKLRAQLKEIRN